MIAFPDIDPVAFRLGPVAVHWYGLAYIAGIALAWWLLHRRAARPGCAWTPQQVGDLVFYAALGGVLGGRLGYILFYNARSYLEDPSAIFAVWQGGMSFHGGVIGMVLAMAWLARRTGQPFFTVSDFIVPVVPIGLGLGRLANFVNQELWGAPTSLPWGVVFSHPAAGGVARHPTQLYEALLEGVLLFVVLDLARRHAPPRGALTGLFLLGYGVFRSLVELLREPDAHIGYLAWGWLTMGHVLSAPMVLAGIVILAVAWRRAAAPVTG
ncbi:MAG: prolipoprotein diacylglyceryl transferase [Gammaproteobacteria bacterium]